MGSDRADGWVVHVAQDTASTQEFRHWKGEGMSSCICTRTVDGDRPFSLMRMQQKEDWTHITGRDAHRSEKRHEQERKREKQQERERASKPHRERENSANRERN